MAQECCEALRWMSSGVRGTKAGIQDDPLYGEVHERARELAAERIRDGIIFSPEEAHASFSVPGQAMKPTPRQLAV